MPELPEVETVVRSLAPRLPGRRIMESHFSSHFVVRQDFQELAGRLRGQQMHSVQRHGKFILIELDSGVLSVHLGMTGKLLLDGEPGAHTRALFELDRGLLVYDDIRHFGRIEWTPRAPFRASQLGPDALTVPLDEFVSMLAGRRAQIKPLLLRQTFLRGLGNIYTDEALHAARIHPKAVAARLSRARAARLHQSIVGILETAIRCKGSSISDYVDADGLKGSFQFHHRVYGREGQACRKCGAKIRRIVVGQRGTYYCPKCQKPQH